MGDRAPLHADKRGKRGLRQSLRPAGKPDPVRCAHFRPPRGGQLRAGGYRCSPVTDSSRSWCAFDHILGVESLNRGFSTRW